MLAITDTSNLHLPKGTTNIRTRHDAKLHVIVTCSFEYHNDPCMDDIVSIDSIQGYLTTMSVIHGKVSGYDSGVSVQYTSQLADPDRDLLINGALCTCERCMA